MQPERSKGTPDDENIDCADDCCGFGLCSSGTGLGPAAARAGGSRQRQLGPASGHRPDHPAVTATWSISSSPRSSSVDACGAVIAQSSSRTLVSSKAPRKPRRVVFVGYVAGRAGHAGAAAAAGLCAVPRPVGMILAHPARAVATRAVRRLGTKLTGHAIDSG